MKTLQVHPQGTPRTQIPTRFWVAGVILSGCSVSLGAFAVWPIYETRWLCATALTALLSGVCAVRCAVRFRWRMPVSCAALFTVWLCTLIPAALPQVFFGPPTSVLTDWAAAATAGVLGWKQLLTVSLPVGHYQGLLVPAYTVMLGSVYGIMLAVRGDRTRGGWAALAFVAPVLFATVWGQASLSDGIETYLGVITAPREIGLWFGAMLVAVGWVAWVTGAQSPRHTRLDTQIWRVVLVLGALLAGIMLAPELHTGQRLVPRATVLPATIMEAQVSPLASYRRWKSDDYLDAPLLTIASSGPLPARLRFAVLEEYDGIEFRVGGGGADAYTRFPQGPVLHNPVEITVVLGSGYQGIWLPTSSLGSPPVFTGDRAEQLTRTLYVNRETGSAIVVPDGPHSPGVGAGDGYRALVSADQPAPLTGGPASSDPLYDLSTTPQLQAWLTAQGQPATAAGYTELVQRLRDRGYLSHSLVADPGAAQWANQLTATAGAPPVPSAGGHSLARIEQLFAELLAQQEIAGPAASAAQLVAAPGDDEQFAAASALLARALGYESRVVIGTRLNTPQVSDLPVCERSCTGAHVAGWVEVRGENGDWAVIDTTPQARIAPTRLTAGSQRAEFDTQVGQHDAAPTNDSLSGGDSPDRDHRKPEPSGPEPWSWALLQTLGIWLLCGGVCALPAVMILLAKRWRARWRKNETDPECAALAAWEELLDHHRDAGISLGDLRTRRAQAAQIGTTGARWAATEVDRAVWSPNSLTMHELTALRSFIDAENCALQLRLTRRRRICAQLSLRSFWVPAQNRFAWAPRGTQTRAGCHGRANLSAMQQRNHRMRQCALRLFLLTGVCTATGVGVIVSSSVLSG